MGIRNVNFAPCVVKILTFSLTGGYLELKIPTGEYTAVFPSNGYIVLKVLTMYLNMATCSLPVGYLGPRILTTCLPRRNVFFFRRLTSVSYSHHYFLKRTCSLPDGYLGRQSSTGYPQWRIPRCRNSTWEWLSATKVQGDRNSRAYRNVAERGQQEHHAATRRRAGETMWDTHIHTDVFVTAKTKATLWVN